jgi:hypothetical protein
MVGRTAINRWNSRRPVSGADFLPKPQLPGYAGNACLLEDVVMVEADVPANFGANGRDNIGCVAMFLV